MDKKEFSKVFYEKISKYWSYDFINEKEDAEYKACNTIYNIDELLKCMVLSKLDLNLSHLEYIEYYYNIDITNTYISNIKNIPKLTDNSILLLKDTRINKTVKATIDEKIKQRSKMRNKVTEINDKIYDITDVLRKKLYRQIGNNMNIDKKLDGYEVEDYLYRNKILNKKDEERIEEYIKQKIFLKTFKLSDIIEKSNIIIKKLSDDIKNLRNKVNTKVVITYNTRNKRQKLESKSIHVLFNFLKENNILTIFLDEIQKTNSDYDFKRIDSFYTTPIKEARDILLNESMPLSLDDIKATGYIPFTDKKIKGKDKKDKKQNEINWWINFFKSNQNVKNKIKHVGLKFLHNIDIHNSL